jgi:hypothetical protein
LVKHQQHQTLQPLQHLRPMDSGQPLAGLLLLLLLLAAEGAVTRRDQRDVLRAQWLHLTRVVLPIWCGSSSSSSSICIPCMDMALPAVLLHVLLPAAVLVLLQTILLLLLLLLLLLALLMLLVLVLLLALLRLLHRCSPPAFGCRRCCRYCSCRSFNIRFPQSLQQRTRPLFSCCCLTSSYLPTPLHTLPTPCCCCCCCCCFLRSSLREQHIPAPLRPLTPTHTRTPACRCLCTRRSFGECGLLAVQGLCLSLSLPILLLLLLCLLVPWPCDVHEQFGCCIHTEGLTAN